MQKYFNNVQTRGGSAVAGARVTIRNADKSLATLYSDNGVTVTTNPLYTNTFGYFEFYAADGRYSIEIAGTGIGTQTISDVLLEDPADGSAALAASGGSALVGFMQAGTGAVARTAQDKQRETVSVKDFGARGDGATDDTLAIQTAIDSGASNVQFPAGTYVISARITVSASGVALQSSQGAVIQHKASVAVGFSALRIRASDVSVVGLTFDGSNASPPLSGNNSFVNVDANGGALDGIAFRQCKFRNLDGYGIYQFAVSGTLSNISLIGCEFKNFTASGTQGCVQLGGPGSAVIISKVRIDSCIWRSVNGSGVSVRSNNGADFLDDVSVTNCLYDAGTSAYTTIGVELWNARNVAITGNVFRNARMGLSIDADQYAVAGNTFENMGSYCIEAGDSNGAAFSGNAFKDFSYGIIFYNGAKDVSITGNTFRSAKAAATTTLNQGWAVQFSGSPTLTGPFERVTFTGNVLYDCSGLRLTRVKDAVIANNVSEVISVDHLGRIQVDPLCDGVFITGNRFRTSVDVNNLIALDGVRVHVRGNDLVSTTGATNTGSAIGNLSGSNLSDCFVEYNRAENFTYIANLQQSPTSSTRIFAKDNERLNCTNTITLPSTAGQKRETPSGGQSDNGDADVTLTGRSNRITRFTVNLTANRTVTLDAATAWQGQEFEVIRIAGGAFTLSVGGLVRLAPFERCKVVYNGSAWVLVEHGTVGGNGGTGVQTTSKSTGVTVNSTRGQITTHNAALAAGATVSFTFTNARINVDDQVQLWRKSGGTDLSYNLWVDSVAAGSCVIAIKNNTAGSLAEALVLGFAVRPCSL
jgi:polygalacturonase